jgi:hypothetical protein
MLPDQGLQARLAIGPHPRLSAMGLPRCVGNSIVRTRRHRFQAFSQDSYVGTQPAYGPVLMRTPVDTISGVLQALAVGFNDYASRSSIYVMRRSRAQRVRFTFAELTHFEGPAAMFRIRTGDVVVVERALDACGTNPVAEAVGRGHNEHRRLLYQVGRDSSPRRERADERGRVVESHGLAADVAPYPEPGLEDSRARSG